jgi:hypothetical protein
MDNKSLYIGLAEKALPLVNLYSINYKYGFKSYGFRLLFK